MSVVFDVLDSLNSIRNVEDLKKRWEIDSKRPQTLSYQAVDMFMNLFSGSTDVGEFIILLSNFTLRYREVISENKYSADDLVWVMPYIRYAERLKTFITCGDTLDFEPDSFADGYRKCFAEFYYKFSDAYDSVVQICDSLPDTEEPHLSKQQWVDLFKCFYNLYMFYPVELADDGFYWWMANIPVPDIDYNFNPWNLNPEYTDDYLQEAELAESDLATIYPFLYLGYGETCTMENEIYNIFEKFNISDLKKADELYDELETRYKLYILIDKFRKDKYIRHYLEFKKILKITTDSSKKTTEKLKDLYNVHLPWNFEIRLRYAIESIFTLYLQGLSSKIFTGEATPADISKVLDDVWQYSNILPEDLIGYLRKVLQDSLKIAEIRFNERQKVLFEMSHSIKNLLASVSEPLDMLKDQLDGFQRRTVENALAGTGLIRDLAVGIHMSMRGEPGTWRKDVLEPGFGATTLDKIILDAVRHAVSNMFDGKYFNQFVRNYFGRDLNTFMQAKDEWQAAVSAQDTFDCINKYFFDFKLDAGEGNLNIPIGDRDSTATKLLILFQELFLNAVKYSSFTEREKRFVKLDIAITPQKWNIKLANSAVERRNVKSSGIGLAVIKNFADLFEAKYDANCKNGTYISNINFSLNK